MNTAEVMTTAMVASWLFQNNQERSRAILHLLGLIPMSISKSRFNRRLHAIPDKVWFAFQRLISQLAIQCSSEQIYTVDSMPMPVCDNIRIIRCRIYCGKEYRGYCASKRRYYYGLKVHALINESGMPVDFVFSIFDQLDTMPLGYRAKAENVDRGFYNKLRCAVYYADAPDFFTLRPIA